MWFFLTSGAVTAAAASYAGYATMAPGSQLYGRTLVHGSDPAQIALTYDDGPNDPHTLHLLDVLDRHQAKATFFLIGKFVRQRPEIARAIQAAGHAIGNSTIPRATASTYTWTVTSPRLWTSSNATSPSGR